MWRMNKKYKHLILRRLAKKVLIIDMTSVMAFSYMAGASLPFLHYYNINHVSRVKAATSSSGTLTTGQTTSTGDTKTTYSQTDIANANNTNIVTTGDNTSKNWDSTGTLTLQNASAGLAGIGSNKGDSWATYKNAVSMTQPLKLNFSMKAIPNSALNSYVQVGAWLGVYFVPMGTSTFGIKTKPVDQRIRPLPGRQTVSFLAVTIGTMVQPARLRRFHKPIVLPIKLMWQRVIPSLRQLLRVSQLVLHGRQQRWGLLRPLEPFQ